MLFYRDIGIVPLLSLVPFIPPFYKVPIYILYSMRYFRKRGNKRDKGQ